MVAPGNLRRVLVWQPVSSIPPLTLDVTAYFAEVLGK
jgi:hypothetical protein